MPIELGQIQVFLFIFLIGFNNFFETNRYFPWIVYLLCYLNIIIINTWIYRSCCHIDEPDFFFANLQCSWFSRICILSPFGIMTMTIPKLHSLTMYTHFYSIISNTECPKFIRYMYKAKNINYTFPNVIRSFFCAEWNEHSAPNRLSGDIYHIISNAILLLFLVGTRHVILRMSSS